MIYGPTWTEYQYDRVCAGVRKALIQRSIRPRWAAGFAFAMIIVRGWGFNERQGHRIASINDAYFSKFYASLWTILMNQLADFFHNHFDEGTWTERPAP